ncbi:MAG TPA: DUF2267 domain-containing protein [Bauldia sp.]|nr:DUF2267 domain-containing protein [Bauldia sp.]
MDSLIEDVAAATGVDRDEVEKAVGIIAAFIAREAPADKVTALFDKLPGARQLADQHQGGGDGLLGVFNDLASAGLGMTEMQAVVMTFVKLAKSDAGAAPVDAVIGSIPGLNQFL